MALGLMSVLVAPAYAVQPPNDTPATAIQVDAVPATLEADTREASTDRVARECVLGRSVWYRYRPTGTGEVKMVTIGSNFDTVLAVYRGAAAPRTMLACNDDAARLASAVRLPFTAGRQYWIAASSCCGEAHARGGDLVLRLYQGGTAAVELTVDTAEAGAVSGRIRIRGTVGCDTPSLVFGEVVASQRVGARVARGRRGIAVRECLPEPTAWVARLDSETGTAFRPGVVAVDVSARGDDGFSNVTLEVEDTLPVSEDPAGRTVR